MQRQTPLMTGETYHIFNRGAHKLPIFNHSDDYKRFQVNLHVGNHSEPVLIREIVGSKKYKEPFSGYPADKSLVDVLGYCLMPTHFHLILRQKTDDGITRFMKKVSGGYSMYFNLKYGHSGTLLQGIFKSSHINTDPYFNWIFAYVHLNPVSLAESSWSEKGLSDVARAQAAVDAYQFSSYYDYYIVQRPERSILAFEEGAQYTEKRKDVIGLLASYGRGRVLFPMLDSFN